MPYEDLLTAMRKCKLSRSTGLAKMILQGTVQGKADRKRDGKKIYQNGQD